MYNKLLILTIGLFFALSAQTQNLNYTLSSDSLVNQYASLKRVYYATRTESKPKIDGVLDDECWQTVGSWDAGFIQQQPHQAKPPSQETEIKILYDDKYLYFALICHDNEPEKMSPLLGRRDDSSVGDIAGIALDSYNDKQTAFEFNITSAGQKVDLMHLGEYGWDFNWDAVWDGKTSLGDSAWYAEMRVPFTQIRFSNEKEQVWGMHIWRYIYRLAEESQWKLIPVDAPAMVYIFGELRGIKDIPHKKNFEVMPYARAKYIPDSEDKQNFGFGLDGKIGVTSNATLDYTINPDFGQVEADPSILNLTSYEVFYDEKRPFFLEGKNILEYNAGTDMLFYSRRIGHAPSFRPKGESVSISDHTSIINALKLTGKNKSGLSLGFANSMTARENATVFSTTEESKVTVEPFTNYFVGRLKQDFNQGSTTIGGMITSTVRNINDEHLNFLPRNSTVGGIDLEHNWLNRKYFINYKNFFSSVKGSETAINRMQRSAVHLYHREDAAHLNYNSQRTSLEGWGGQIGGGKRSGKFRLQGELDWRSPGIDFNDVGYLRQADYISEGIVAMYQVNKPRGIFLNYYYSALQQQTWSYGGEKLKSELDGHIGLRFKNYYGFDFNINRLYNEFDTRQLRGGPALKIDDNTIAEIAVRTNSSKKLSFRAGMEAAKSDDKITWKNTYNIHVIWKVKNNFTVSSRSSFAEEKDNSQYIKQLQINNKREYVVGKIQRQTLYTTLRMEYFINPELSLQLYASPYASSGKFLSYRKVNQSKAKDLNLRYSPLNVKFEGDNKYLTDTSGESFLDFAQENPDFNFQEFNSNFVLRWEYKTGSSFYFVWTNYRSSYEDVYDPSIANSFKNISNVKSQNAFMLKFSYWFSL